MTALRDEFDEKGLIGPVSILKEAECRRIRRLLEGAPATAAWVKGHAASSPAYHGIGTHAAIVDRVAELIGEDVMLWGATLVRRRPGQVHLWHTDIETSFDAPGTVTVWLGLENTNRRSALQLISHSHRFGMTVQERAQRGGKQREDVTIEDVVRWSKEVDPRSDLVQPDMRDGQAIFFDGRVWHGSSNTSTEGTRTALLLQYAIPDRPLHIPDLEELDYPFRLFDEPRPPCVMVRGSARNARNRIVPAPTANGDSPPLSWVRTLELPLDPDEQTGWIPYGIFQGTTRCMGHLSCHVSVLSPGTTPHEPHAHAEEELLVMLEGEAQLVIVDGEGRRRMEAVGPGAFAYYPAGQSHTIHNGSSGPATYLMFKWGSEKAVDHDHTPLPTEIFRYDAPPFEADRDGDRGWISRHVFEGPTRYLRKLHCHHTTIYPGAGYEPHVDAYDVGILVLRGEVETLGSRVGPHGVVFYSAGEPHGMQNVGPDPASYLVFEFHSGPQKPPPPTLTRRLIGLVPRGVRARVPGRLRDLAVKVLR